MEKQILCESCLMVGIGTPATTHSINLDWSGYNLCDECAEEYNNRESIDDSEAISPLD